MIRSFKDKETEKVFRGERSKKLPGEIQARARARLVLLNVSGNIGADFKAFGLHPLRGDMKGFHAFDVNDQWRIIFQWEKAANEAYVVGIFDYHH